MGDVRVVEAAAPIVVVDACELLRPSKENVRSGAFLSWRGAALLERIVSSSFSLVSTPLSEVSSLSRPCRHDPERRRVRLRAQWTWRSAESRGSG